MNSEEILTCLIFVIIGYFVAMMFSKCNCNGFRVGTRITACSPNNCPGNPGKEKCERCFDNYGFCEWMELLDTCSSSTQNPDTSLS